MFPNTPPEFKDAIITGNLGPKSTPDFLDLKFDPGEAHCSTKNVEKDLDMLSEVLKMVEIQHDDKFGAGHKKEIKLYKKSIEGLEDEFDSTQEAFEDYQEFRDVKETTKVDAKMILEYPDEFDSTEEFLLQIRDTEARDTFRRVYTINNSLQQSH